MTTKTTEPIEKSLFRERLDRAIAYVFAAGVEALCIFVIAVSGFSPSFEAFLPITLGIIGLAVAKWYRDTKRRSRPPLHYHG